MTGTPDAPVAPMSLIARAIGVVTNPTQTFQHIVAAPRLAGIIFLVGALIGVGSAVPQLSERVRMSMVDMQLQQVEKFTGQPASPQMREQFEQGARAPYRSAIFTFLGSLISMPFFVLITGLIVWVIFNTILGGEATFKQVLAVVAHASVISAVGMLIDGPLQYFMGQVKVGGAFNLAAAVPMLPPSSFLVNFLQVITVFGIWGTIVNAIGLGVLYRRSTTNIAIGLFVMYGLFAAGWAWFASRFAA